MFAPVHLYAWEGEYVFGEVLVKFKVSTRAEEETHLLNSLKAFKKWALPKIKLYRLKLPKQMSVAEAAA